MKSKKVANILVWSLILFFVMIIAINWYSISGRDVTVEEYLDEEEAIEVITVSQDESTELDDGDETEAQMNATEDMIAAVHSELNSLVGWNRYRGFSWNRNENRLLTIVENLETIVEIETNDARRKDVQNTMAAIKKAMDGRDTQGIIHAHRIMHDLDYYVNGNVGDGIRYDVTQYQ